jgi:ribosome-associated protein
MQQFKLTSEYIELCQLLKLEGPFQSGGEVKHAILGGLVTVDGELEKRRKCKLRDGQVVRFQSFNIEIIK